MMLNSSQQKRPGEFLAFSWQNIYSAYPNLDEPFLADPSHNTVDALPFVTMSYF